MSLPDYLIRCGHLWWRPDECGYTDNLLEAGLYTEERARRQQESRPELDRAVHIDEALASMRVSRDTLALVVTRALARRALSLPEIERMEQALCGAAFVQGQLLGGLRSIEREGDDCDCGYDSCGCGKRTAWMADDLCDLLAEVAP